MPPSIPVMARVQAVSDVVRDGAAGIGPYRALLKAPLPYPDNTGYSPYPSVRMAADDSPHGHHFALRGRAVLPQCDETKSDAACAGGTAKLFLMRLTSATGGSPKRRLNSRLNCDALSYPTA